MPDEWAEVDTIQELKQKAEKYRADTKFRWEDFKFKKATSDSPTSPDAHCEFLILYNRNHIETFSLDRMSAEKIERKLEEIREANPQSMDDWLNRRSSS